MLDHMTVVPTNFNQDMLDELHTESESEDEANE